jgi:hypothetical protein
VNGLNKGAGKQNSFFICSSTLSVLHAESGGGIALAKFLACAEKRCAWN